MSKILRRPMFRGGAVNSGGTGITSGLDTPKRGMVDGPGGYAGLSLAEQRAKLAYEKPGTTKYTDYSDSILPLIKDMHWWVILHSTTVVIVLIPLISLFFSE